MRMEEWRHGQTDKKAHSAYSLLDTVCAKNSSKIYKACMFRRLVLSPSSGKGKGRLLYLNMSKKIIQ